MRAFHTWKDKTPELMKNVTLTQSNSNLIGASSMTSSSGRQDDSSEYKPVKVSEIRKKFERS